MKKNKKESNKFLMGFMNNISLFITTIIISFIFVFSFSPKFSTYSICSYSSDYCDCGYNGMKFDYTPGLLHNIILLLFVIIYIAIIICSIYLVIKSIKKKKVVEIILNIIFAIFICLLVYSLPIGFYKLDKQYGNKIQVDKEILDRHSADAYINDSC